MTGGARLRCPWAAAAAVFLLALAPAEAALRIGARTAALAAEAALSHPKEPKEPKEHHSHKHEKSPPLLPPEVNPGSPSAGKARNCSAPEPGDKVVYFIRHGQKDWGADPVLTRMGQLQAYMLKLQPALGAALSANSSHRAQLLLISPLRRTLETAIRGFGGQFPAEQWLLTTEVMEQEIRDKPEFAKGEAMLQAPELRPLLEQYRALTANWTAGGGTTNRDDNRAQADRFAELLLTRPEERFIVVTHHWFAENIGGHNLNEGKVGVSALTPSGSWRRLDLPDCWPQFREQWPARYLEIQAGIAALQRGR